MTEKIYLVCPSCQTKNRIPADRTGKHPNCGQCGSALFPDAPFDLDETELNKHLGSDSIPLLVDFWAPWCGPCKVMAPMFASASQKLSPSVRFAKLNTEYAPGAGQRFAIRGIPLMILFDKGREVARSAGARDTKGIVDWVETNLQI